MRVCVEYDEICTHSESENVQYGSWRESYSSDITDVYMIGEDTKVPWNSETFLVPDGHDAVFVVYMIYNTGDSFGHADGKIDIIHCTVNEDAAAELAKAITENRDEFSIKFTDDFGRDISIDNRGAGYFESIDYVGVERYNVGSGKSKKRYYVK